MINKAKINILIHNHRGIIFLLYCKRALLIKDYLKRFE